MSTTPHPPVTLIHWSVLKQELDAIDTPRGVVAGGTIGVAVTAPTSATRIGIDIARRPDGWRVGYGVTSLRRSSYSALSRDGTAYATHWQAFAAGLRDLSADPLAASVSASLRDYAEQAEQAEQAAAEAARPRSRPADPLPPLIALAGPAGVGKSTIAVAVRVRAGLDSQQFSFALPIKMMADRLLRHAGYNPTEAFRLLNSPEGKRTCIPELGGITVRRLLQTLGTEWGRTHLGNTVWTDLCMRAAGLARHAGGTAIIDDCRFPDEARAVLNAGGIVVRLVRPGQVVDASEVGIPDPLVTATLLNDGDPETVADRVLALCEVHRA